MKAPKSKMPAPASCWRRWIQPGQEDLWVARLQALNVPWVITELPTRKRILLESYGLERAPAVALQRLYGGQVRSVKPSEWIGPSAAPPTRIGKHLEITHEKAKGKPTTIHRLNIPHGVAFGSGDHATTSMLLRALIDRGDWTGTHVLDLGTGSGVLAIAARLLGARKIVATDFDAEAVRTARQNEALNFPDLIIRWQCADVKKLHSSARYGLVLANLFSGILTEAAPQIAGSVSPEGQLWLSGILRTQQDEVSAAYGDQGLRILRATTRGKWVMLQWRKP